MSDKHTVLLAPVTWEAAPGVGRINADCGHECWVGEAMMKSILSGSLGEHRTVCMPCTGITPADLKRMGREGSLREVPGMREEVAGHFGKEAANAMFKIFHVKGMTD